MTQKPNNKQRKKENQFLFLSLLQHGNVIDRFLGGITTQQYVYYMYKRVQVIALPINPMCIVKQKGCHELELLIILCLQVEATATAVWID